MSIYDALEILISTLFQIIATNIMHIKGVIITLNTSLIVLPSDLTTNIQTIIKSISCISKMNKIVLAINPSFQLCVAAA